MVRFYADQNISEGTVLALRERGYDVATARERDRTRDPDYLYLLVAVQEDRVLLTYNGRDFKLLHGAWRSWSNSWNIDITHRGILILLQPPRFSPEAAAERVVSQFADGVPANELFALEADGSWLNSKPL